MSSAHTDNGGIFGIERLTQSDDANLDSNVDFGERISIGEIALLVMMAFIVLVAYRSMNEKRWCWWRIVLLYAIGTFLFILEQTVNDGVTKITTFGIALHNMGEWYMVLNMWFGRTSPRIMVYWVPVYIYLMLMAMLLIPLKPLFLVAAIQGATLDVMLPISWGLMHYYAHSLKLSLFAARSERPKCRCECNPLVWGIAGATMHAFGVIVIFGGLNAGSVSIAKLGSLLTFPTFVCYSALAASAEGTAKFIGPSGDETYSESVQRFRDDATAYSHIGLGETSRYVPFACMTCRRFKRRSPEDASVKPTMGEEKEDATTVAVVRGDNKDVYYVGPLTIGWFWIWLTFSFIVASAVNLGFYFAF